MDMAIEASAVQTPRPGIPNPRLWASSKRRPPLSAHTPTCTALSDTRCAPSGRVYRAAVPGRVMGSLRLAGTTAPNALGIDLGTARTRLLIPGVGLILDEPSGVAYSPSGKAIAAGYDAWSAVGEGKGRLRSPVRGGVVRDPVACVHMLSLLLRKAGLNIAATRDVTLSLPATAHRQDALVAAAVVASATDRRVIPVESGLAACVGAGLDITLNAPRVVCDLGAGVTEVAAVADGRVVTSVAARVELGAYDRHPARALRRVAQMLRRTLEALPDRSVGEVATAPLLLVGGGALRLDLVTRLGDSCRMQVQVPVNPRDVVGHGLANCVIGFGRRAKLVSRRDNPI